MITEKQKTNSLGGVRIFGNVQVLVLAALFIALSIVLGKLLSFTIGPFRISFENLTILMSGIFFGPVVGAVVGIAADIIGCLIVGYTINPIITLGAACIGLTAGLFSRHFLKKNNKTLNLAVSIGAAHILGSMIIKSIGLHVYYAYPFETLILRIPLYIIIGVIEFYIIYFLLKNKEISAMTERMGK